MNDEPIEALKADESQTEVESPATEELPEQVESEQVEVESTEEATTEVPQETEGRKTANSRIRELVAEKKDAEAKAKSLAEQLREATAPQPMQYQPPVQDGDEVTLDEILRKSDAMTQIRLAQQENLHRIDKEALEAISQYKQLDPDSESFDKDLSESISKATRAIVFENPIASVKEFVDSLMKPYTRSVEKQAQGQADIITKQASEQAMRPTQVQEQEKPFSELSIEEMEKKLGKVYH